MDILNKTNIQNKILRAPEFGDEGGGGTSSSSSNVINIGGVEVDKFYLGNSADVKIFLGDVKLYPRDISYKLVAQHSDLTEYKVACNGSSVLSSAETKADSASASTRNVTIGDCVTELGAYTFNSFANLTGVTLPSGLTTIGERCFDSTHGITSITLPNSVVTINDSAFRHMHGLKELNIPSGVTTIPNMCFNDCTALSSFTIPSNITSISGNAFSYCTALKEVHFQGTTPPVFGTNVFNGSTSIEKIYIPSCDNYDAYAAALPNYTDLLYAESDSKCKQEAMPYAMYRVSRNGSGVTVACNSSSSNTVTSANTRTGITTSSLTSSTATQTPVEIKFGDCCKVISTGACSGWTYLTSVTISDSVTGLSGNYQFLSCKRMKEFKVGNGLKSIGATQFAYNLGSAYSAQSASNWVDVDFSRTTNLTIGGGSTFAYAYINNLKFGSGVQINGTSCFQNAHINSIKFNGSGSIGGGSNVNGKFYLATIGSIDFGSVTSIGDYAFARTSGLTSVSIPNSVTAMGGYIFSGASDITEVTLNYNGSNVGDGIFSGVGSLRKVTFGSHPTKIGDTMFNDCTSLSAVTIPNNITYIGDQAFYNCSSLVSCKLPNNINEIRGYTFCNCTSLTSITIPSSVTEIDSYAFSGCVMQYAEVLATTPPSLPGNYTFTSTYPIYVPDASVDAYKSAGGDWSQYTSRIKPLSQKP